MKKIKLVTDSTADLPKEIVEEFGISVIPLNVHAEGEVYRDGVDITASTFYEKLRAMESLPTTSQPSPGDFKELYEKLAEDDCTIISIHISSKLSGTYQSAILAKAMLEDLDINVIDSETVSMSLGLIALNVAKAIEEEKSKEEILALVDSLKANNKVLFVVDTLEYLQKGGRIGKAQALLGSLLNIKPILTVAEGVVSPVEKVRGQKKALEKLIQLAADYATENTQVAIVHGANEEGLNKIKERLASEIKTQVTISSEVGPVVGTHVGPGVLGIMIQNR